MKHSTGYMVLIAAIWASPANARCMWLCVNGAPEALCEQAIDVEPPMPAIWCRQAPKYTPSEGDKLPPLGTTECKMAWVLNPYTDQYVWKRLCR